MRLILLCCTALLPDTGGGGVVEWRPAFRCTSVWRPVGPKSTSSSSKPLIHHHRMLSCSNSSSSSSSQQQQLPQLSPGPVAAARYSLTGVPGSERSTPSESPSPRRPASASSGFFDSSQACMQCCYC